MDLPDDVEWAFHDGLGWAPSSVRHGRRVFVGDGRVQQRRYDHNDRDFRPRVTAKDARYFVKAALERTGDNAMQRFNGETRREPNQILGFKAFKCMMGIRKLYVDFSREGYEAVMPTVSFLRQIAPEIFVADKQTTLPQGAEFIIGNSCTTWFANLDNHNSPVLHRFFLDPNDRTVPNFETHFFSTFVEPYHILQPLTQKFECLVYSNYSSAKIYLDHFDEWSTWLMYLGGQFTEQNMFMYIKNHLAATESGRKDMEKLLSTYGAHDYWSIRGALLALYGVNRELEITGQSRDIRFGTASGSRQRDQRQGQRGQFGRGNRGSYHHIGFDEAGLDYDSSPEDVSGTFCTFCDVQMDDSTCVCEDYLCNIDGLNDFEEVADCYLLAFSSQGNRPQRTAAEAKRIVDNAICRQCNKKGHFVRDCETLGGNGSSVLGAKFGSAKGFKEGDDPNDRPKSYRDARLASARKAQAISTRIQASKRGPESRTRQQGGKFGTHARRMRTGKATAPGKSHYQDGGSHNMYATSLLFAFCETVDDPEVYDFPPDYVGEFHMLAHAQGQAFE